MVIYFEMIMVHMVQHDILLFPNRNMNELSKYVLRTVLNKVLTFI